MAGKIEFGAPFFLTTVGEWDPFVKLSGPT